jgi:hypothetical protein
MLLLKVIAQSLTIPTFDAIMMVRNGSVYVDGLQRTDPVFQINKPCAIKAGGQRLWISPPIAKGNHGSE